MSERGRPRSRAAELGGDFDARASEKIRRQNSAGADYDRVVLHLQGFAVQIEDRPRMRAITSVWRQLKSTAAARHSFI
jgi:hypothetical protein